MKKTIQQLKSYFETGDTPTEQEFCDLIESFVHLDDAEDIVNQSFIEASYSYDDLTILKQAGALIPGKKYIITDYQTQYYVENSNTSAIQREEKIESIVSNYAAFNEAIPVSIGTKITVTSLPDTYMGSIQVGDTTTITSIFSGGLYVRMANNLNLVLNATFSYSVPRYSEILEDSIILDESGRTVMQPNGLVNTEVHDGKPYMDMTSSENQAPPIESLVVTAITENRFASEATSLTFEGDVVTYDFEDNIIRNEDGKEIAKRRGFITRRANEQLNIDIDKDWRAQRYRRFKIEETLWNNFILKQELYKTGNQYAATLANQNVTQAHRYVLPEIENRRFYLDFTLGDAMGNPFLNGDETAAQIRTERRMFDPTKYMQDILVANVAAAKDIQIIPLDEKYEPVKVRECIIQKSDNVVFAALKEQVGNYSGHEVNVNEISKSTILTTSILKSVGSAADGIVGIISLDRLILTNTGIVTNLINFVYSFVNNAGRLENVTLGAMPASQGGVGVSYFSYRFDNNTYLKECLLGGKRVDGWSFSNVEAKSCMFLQRLGTQLSYYNSKMYLTGIQDNSDKEVLRIKLNTFKAKNPLTNLYGYFYKTGANISEVDVSFQNEKGALLYQQAFGNGVTPLTTYVELCSPVTFVSKDFIYEADEAGMQTMNTGTLQLTPEVNGGEASQFLKAYLPEDVNNDATYEWEFISGNASNDQFEVVGGDETVIQVTLNEGSTTDTGGAGRLSATSRGVVIKCTATFSDTNTIVEDEIQLVLSSRTSGGTGVFLRAEQINTNEAGFLVDTDESILTTVQVEATARNKNTIGIIAGQKIGPEEPIAAFEVITGAMGDGIFSFNGTIDLTPDAEIDVNGVPLEEAGIDIKVVSTSNNDIIIDPKHTTYTIAYTPPVETE